MSKFIQTEGIVLRSYNLSDSDKIVVIFTAEDGIVRGYANGARKLKSKFGSSLEPFTIVSLNYRHKELNELVRLEKAELVASHFTLASQSNSFEMANYWCELVLEFIPAMMTDKRVYRLLSNSIKLLAIHSASAKNLSCYFVVWLLKLTGYFPSLSYCRICRKKKSADYISSFSQSGVICSDCFDVGRKHDVSEIITVLREILTLTPQNFLQRDSGTETSINVLNTHCEQIIKNVIEERYLKFAS